MDNWTIRKSPILQKLRKVTTTCNVLFMKRNWISKSWKEADKFQETYYEKLIFLEVKRKETISTCSCRWSETEEFVFYNFCLDFVTSLPSKHSFKDLKSCSLDSRRNRRHGAHNFSECHRIYIIAWRGCKGCRNCLIRRDGLYFLCCYLRISCNMHRLPRLNELFGNLPEQDQEKSRETCRQEDHGKCHHAE